MNNTFRSRQSVRAVVRYPSGGTMIPPSPWIGSTKKAQVFGVIAFSSAAGSPYGTMRNPGANGPISLDRRKPDDRRRPAVEVPVADDDLGLIRGDALATVSPAARELDRGLDRFGSRIHRDRHLLLGERAEPLQKAR